MPDHEIEQLEAELRESRVKMWDVEKLLADRHRAKIEALEQPKTNVRRAWQALCELGVYVFAYIGFAGVFVLFALWLLKGPPY